MIFARTSSSDNFYWKSQKLLISGRECYFITSADLQQFAIHLPIMKQYHITINSRSHYCNKSNRTHISFIIRFVWNVERFFFVLSASSSFYFCFISLDEILLFDLLPVISIILVPWNRSLSTGNSPKNVIELQMVGLCLPNYPAKTAVAMKLLLIQQL